MPTPQPEGGGSKPASWKPLAIVAAAVLALALGAFLFGSWYSRRAEHVCVLTSEGTVVCGSLSGPAGWISSGGRPLVQPQGINYQEGRRKVTETRCRDEAEGVQVCTTTEHFE
jgi:hypothetical protein